MNATIHRVLITLGSFAAGLGAVFALPDAGIIGIPTEAGAVTAIVSAVVMLAANVWRANWPEATV